MKILVIGGTGVVSHLMVARWLDLECRVTILTDGRGTFPVDNRIVRHVICDRNSVSDLSVAVRDGTFWDLVVDTVCFSANQALSLLNATRDICGARVLLGTSLVYDCDQASPISEKFGVIAKALRNDYVRGKVRAESAYLEFDQAHGGNLILRAPHILGQGSLVGALPLHNRDAFLLKRILDRKPLVLVNSGQVRFSYVCPEDLAEVCLHWARLGEKSNVVANCAASEVLDGVSYYERLAAILGREVLIESIPREIICHSNWGWQATACDRILDTTLLNQWVPNIQFTPFQSIAENAVHWLEREDRTGTESEYQKYGALLDEIARGSWKRIGNIEHLLASLRLVVPTSNVDIRMNR
ncbi:NAD-dependent epimerase/dehydratase family protein [Candidatus Thiodictyon syntrophicum]|jgi:nucleoside-diphosphate-sugar epimerase|uniref:NAD-dependent epimerase/dehydratase domain-containing protein n=1 Tax=Candidatus Thiodictyon syntrophicum TaxID=1166950 RepID=A0A2K8U441_9GAMM|nr:NAD-dependent epimerase/dehydratase family protein [Candidatus Thiodictyon syntrophicum]AUB80305.1 hypothetical protein THSYN_04610 [Candidatus Thiodictyon syntrophicum]